MEIKLTNRILMIVQQQEFEEELKTIRNNQPLKKNNKLSSLDPLMTKMDY